MKSILITFTFLLSFSSFSALIEKGDKALTTLENGQNIVGSVRSVSGESVYIKAFKNGNRFYLKRNINDVSKLVKSRGIFSKRKKVEFKNSFGELRIGTIKKVFENGTVEVFFYQDEYARAQNELQTPIRAFIARDYYVHLN